MSISEYEELAKDILSRANDAWKIVAAALEKEWVEGFKEGENTTTESEGVNRDLVELRRAKEAVRELGEVLKLAHPMAKTLSYRDNHNVPWRENVLKTQAVLTKHAGIIDNGKRTLAQMPVCME